MKKRKTEKIIAGFWRRAGAIGIDIAILGVFLNVIALPFSGLAYQLGPYGRFVGFTIGVAYFGMLNSTLRDGQTIGKQILKIKVIDQNGNHLSVIVSLLRSCLWLFPFSVVSLELPLLQFSPFLKWGLIILATSVLLLIFISVVFNANSRQGLHDLICRSYVVNANPRQGYGSLPEKDQIDTKNAVIIGGILLLLGIFVAYGSGDFHQLDDFYEVRQEIAADPRFFTVNITTGTFGDYGAGFSDYTTVEIWHKDKVNNDGQAAVFTEVAQMVIAGNEDLPDDELLIISLKNEYDLFFAVARRSYYQRATVEEWKSVIEP